MHDTITTMATAIMTAIETPAARLAVLAGSKGRWLLGGGSGGSVAGATVAFVALASSVARLPAAIMMTHTVTSDCIVQRVILVHSVHFSMLWKIDTHS